MAHTKETQSKLTPDTALTLLKEGNQRFLSNSQNEKDLKAQVQETSAGQFPFAAVLACIDSRVPVETVFDQGIGDIFTARVAGNIVNEDILGSLEYACKVAGSKLIVVLGHSKCGAVTAACQGVELGNITALLSKVKPAVNAVLTDGQDLDDASIEAVTKENIHQSVKTIRERSAILDEMVTTAEIKIVGAYYDVVTGEVSFSE